MNLRYIERDGKQVLQWQIGCQERGCGVYHTKGHEFEDIPIVKVEPEVRKPREFWVNIYDEEVYIFKSKAHAKEFSRPYRRDTICVREVLPDEITDTMRLDWLMANHHTITTSGGNYYISGLHGFFKTPRDAIDAAMKESK